MDDYPIGYSRDSTTTGGKDAVPMNCTCDNQVTWIRSEESLPPSNSDLKWTTDGVSVGIGRHMGFNVWSSLQTVTHWADIDKPTPPEVVE